MQPPLEPFQLTSYQLRTLGRCYHTLRKYYLWLSIYQSHLRTHYISTDIYVPIFWLLTNSLLLSHVPVQDHTQQLALHKVSTLDIPHGNFSACYDTNTKYLGITEAKTMTVEISEHQFHICRDANGQFCNIDAPLQPLTNPPSCITGLYAKNTASINTRCSLQIRNTNSISIPTLIAPNVWVLTSAPSAVMTGMILICPEVATRSITP